MQPASNKRKAAAPPAYVHAEDEVDESALSAQHPPWAELMGSDVCVLAKAYPDDAAHCQPGTIGWRAEVQIIDEAKQLVRVFGSWFVLANSEVIRPIKQLAPAASSDACGSGGKASAPSRPSRPAAAAATAVAASAAGAAEEEEEEGGVMLSSVAAASDAVLGPLESDEEGEPALAPAAAAASPSQRTPSGKANIAVPTGLEGLPGYQLLRPTELKRVSVVWYQDPTEQYRGKVVEWRQDLERRQRVAWSFRVAYDDGTTGWHPAQSTYVKVLDVVAPEAPLALAIRAADSVLAAASTSRQHSSPAAHGNSAAKDASAPRGGHLEGSKNSSTGFKGVYFNGYTGADGSRKLSAKPFRATAQDAHGKAVHLGTFDSREEAAAVHAHYMAEQAVEEEEEEVIEVEEEEVVEVEEEAEERLEADAEAQQLELHLSKRGSKTGFLGVFELWHSNPPRYEVLYKGVRLPLTFATAREAAVYYAEHVRSLGRAPAAATSSPRAGPPSMPTPKRAAAASSPSASSKVARHLPSSSSAASRAARPTPADVGRRLAVFWARERQWFEGVLTAFEAGHDDGGDVGDYHVRYDDGDAQWEALGSRTKFVWVDDRRGGGPFRQPTGRPPRGKVWDASRGQWADIGRPIARASASRSPEPDASRPARTLALLPAPAPDAPPVPPAVDAMERREAEEARRRQCILKRLKADYEAGDLPKELYREMVRDLYDL